ncbi:hypothetical protein [Paenibacillus sp. FSL H7-0323]|jgi:hypothetical protein|uniref:hypothetical protein n=1 Tax=Paenibacillus sp. FSL H7-0323 TaxID=2921433 RepID=UPI0030F67B47
MSYYKYLTELYEIFAENIRTSNVMFNASNPVMVSIETLSILVSECLVEDIKYVIKFKKLDYPKRYVDALIRNMCEQTIEYIYVMRNQHLLDEYFGKNLPEDCEEIGAGPEVFEFFRQTGGARFNSVTRISVRKMAMSIEEVDTTDEKISLYTIFANKAELEHNSYFNHIFDIIDEIEDFKSQDLDDIFVAHIINAFLEVYNSVDCG